MIENMQKEIQKLKLPERFLRFRHKLDLTQQEASNLFNVDVTTWQSWEYGHNIPRHQHIHLLESYEINPPNFLTIPKMCAYIRKKLGLRKMDMAKMFDVQLNTWGYWERGVMKPIGIHKEKIEKIFADLQNNEVLSKAS
jgi:DNA-binding transcriptional regulator YiaG